MTDGPNLERRISAAMNDIAGSVVLRFDVEAIAGSGAAVAAMSVVAGVALVALRVSQGDRTERTLTEFVVAETAADEAPSEILRELDEPPVSAQRQRSTRGGGCASRSVHPAKP